MAAPPLDKIVVLDSIEKEIISCLQSAGKTYKLYFSVQIFMFFPSPPYTGQALQELGKDKSSLKNVESHTSQFVKSLKLVESTLSEQINYLTQVSTGQPHEGSGYASAKVLQMAWHRIHHVRSRVRELEESKQKHLQGQGGRALMATQQPQQRSAAQNGVNTGGQQGQSGATVGGSNSGSSTPSQT